MPKSPNTSTGSSIRPKRPVRPLDTTDLVLTPGGMRPRSLVHELKEGEEVSTAGGKIQVIESATGTVVKDLGETPTETETEAESRSAIAGVVPSLPDIGWIENSQWRNGGTEPIVYFSTKWIVPAAPTSSDSQTIFLFNGLQPDSAAHILQPVLQWGPSAAGGGNYWSITNWYADGQHGPAVYKSPVQVSAGTVLQGVMTCTGKTGTEYNYKSSFVGYTSLDVVATGVDELTWAYETLECYGSNPSLPLTKCSDYPNAQYTAMYDIEIRTGSPGTNGTDASISWYAATAFTDCGQICRIASNNSPGGEVDLFYTSVNWEQLDNNPATVALAVDGANLYQRHNNGQIWKYVGPAFTGWQELDNNPRCVQIAASGGNLYELHNNGMIWKYVGPPISGWQQLDGNPACVQIAAGAGNLYERHNTGLIWKYTGPPLTGWQELDNNPASISIVADGNNLYQLHKDGSIWKYVGPALTGWQQLDGNPACIAISASGGNLYQLHKDGSIWKYVSPPMSGWQQLDNNPACVAIASDGIDLYELHNTGKIWRYLGPPITGWQNLDSNPATTAIVAGGGNLYQLHKDGSIWKFL